MDHNSTQPKSTQQKRTRRGGGAGEGGGLKTNPTTIMYFEKNPKTNQLQLQATQNSYWTDFLAYKKTKTKTKKELFEKKNQNQTKTIHKILQILLKNKKTKTKKLKKQNNGCRLTVFKRKSKKAKTTKPTQNVREKRVLIV